MKKIIRHIHKKAKTNFDISQDILISSCMDEYQDNISMGIDKRDALKKSLIHLKQSIRNHYDFPQSRNPYKLSLILSSTAFIVSIILLIFNIFINDLLYIVNKLYPLFLFLLIIVLIYARITSKKRSWLDFLISGILLIGIIIVNIEALIYFHKPRTTEFFNSLHYVFPGRLLFNRHQVISCIDQDKILYTINLFDPTFIISFICLMISILFSIIDKKKKKQQFI